MQLIIEQKSANRVEIAISDDGAGIDPQRVREAVVKSGLSQPNPHRRLGIRIFCRSFSIPGSLRARSLRISRAEA